MTLRDQSVVALARRLSVSDCHLRAVMLGERRPSTRLYVALVRELGPRAWAFVSGAADVLLVS